MLLYNGSSWKSIGAAEEAAALAAAAAKVTAAGGDGKFKNDETARESMRGCKRCHK